MSLAELPDAALLRGPQTFMSAPFSQDASRAQAAILGCPFDCGIHAFRIGSRQGPEAIRAQSGLVRRYDSERADLDVIAEMGVIDAGDVICTPSRIDESFAAIEEAVFRLARQGTAPVGFGGDGSISLPLLRGVSRVHPGIAVLHIDSHTDAYPVNPAHPIDPSTQFTHAAQEQRAAQPPLAPGPRVEQPHREGLQPAQPLLALGGEARAVEEPAELVVKVSREVELRADVALEAGGEALRGVVLGALVVAAHDRGDVLDEELASVKDMLDLLDWRLNGIEAS